MTDNKNAETCTWRERQWLDYRGGVQCTCDTYPETTSGPEEDCEIHGRPYEEWVKRADKAEAELARAEIVKPGHVQVRVDDLDPQTVSEWSQWAGCDVVETALLRVGCASIARQVGQGDPTADEPDTNVEAFPHTVMVELRCPHGCGAPVRAKLSTEGYSFPEGGAWPRLVAVPQHICLTAQPDEPTEFGARVTLDGHRWLRSGVAPRPFVNRHGARASWEELCATARRATLAITLGWGDES